MPKKYDFIPPHFVYFSVNQTHNDRRGRDCSLPKAVPDMIEGARAEALQEGIS